MPVSQSRCVEVRARWMEAGCCSAEAVPQAAGGPGTLGYPTLFSINVSVVLCGDGSLGAAEPQELGAL